MAYETLELTVDENQVATLTLMRPEIHNAMNPLLILEMRHVMDELRKQVKPRAMVLTGSGKSFCAGADLNWMKEMTGQEESERMKDAKELASMLGDLNNLGCLVIGRINGAAYGGGIGLVSCCDIAIGAESSRFSLSEVTLGVIPATISPFVIQRIGSSNARRVMLNGHRFGAQEAVRLGLLHRSVPDSGLDEAVNEEIKAVLRCAPEAVRAAKDLIGAVRGRELESVKEETAERLAQTWKTESCREGIAAFLEKRKAAWHPES